MKIQLDKYYQNVNGVQLAPGIHDVKPDLAAYLINSGHALPVASGPEPEPLALPLQSDIDPDSDVDPLPEIDEPTVDKPRPFTPKPKGKR